MSNTNHADLSEARRLLYAGMHLVKLEKFKKRPEGLEWNKPAHRAKSIDPDATGYGLPLASNKLCSVDPDNWPLAVKGMRALGFDLEAIMSAGVRTKSTRKGSGGRSVFAEEVDLAWLKFASREPSIGTVLELRADSSNLQDCVPGVVYFDNDGVLCSQQYANSKRLDEAPGLPDELLDWWQRCSTDVEFLRAQQEKFFDALGVLPNRANSTGKAGSKLAHPAPGVRGPFNRTHQVEDFLERHGYEWHAKLQRWSCPTASGAPGIRPIPGKDGLWQSDHASDPLSGTFDAWTAFVVLDHMGDLDAAVAAARIELALPAPQSQPTSLDYAPLHERAEASNEPRYKLLTGTDLEGLPPLRWLVRGVLPAEGLAALYGPSGSGKSFLSQDLFTAVAEGRRWFDCRVEARPVVYVALEGEAGLKVRVQAWEVHHGRKLPEAMRLVLQPFKLTDAQDVADLAAAILQAGGAGAVVVLDTLNRAAPTADENSSRDMGEILEGAKALQRMLGGLVVLVHHSGKDVARGMRGHSSMYAALDASIEVSRDGERRAWTVAKSKDGQDGVTHPFRLEVIDLGADEYGDPITSCVTVPADPNEPSRAKSMTPRQVEGWEALLRAATEHGDEEGDRVHIPLEAWRNEFYKTSTADGKEAKKKAFQRVRTDLASLGRVTVNDDVYSISATDGTWMAAQLMATFKRQQAEQADTGTPGRDGT